MSIVIHTGSRTELDGTFVDGVRQFTHQLARLEQESSHTTQPIRGSSLHQSFLKVLSDSVALCQDFELKYASAPETIEAAQAYFRDETEPWLSQSWFAHRARTKPSGFAGDYDMLVKIYERSTPATGFGAYLDMCFMDLPLACAVRSRMVKARSFLLAEIAARQRPLRVLDIASGPCREFLDWPLTGHPVEVVALDSDPLALEYVQEQVVPQLPATTTVESIRYNAMRTRSAEANKRKFGSFDIIYSVGLCDYLTDDHLISMFSAWKDTLSPEGVLYIAFKDTERYDQTPYQWHLDWFFYQRTQEDVLRLYEAAGFDIAKLLTSRDDTGIIINFVARPQPGEIIRHDDASDSLMPRAIPAATRTRAG